MGALGTLMTAGGVAVVVRKAPDPMIDTLAGVLAIAGLAMMFTAAFLWVRRSFYRD